jgi:hypothetical protein
MYASLATKEEFPLSFDNQLTSTEGQVIVCKSFVTLIYILDHLRPKKMKVACFHLLVTNLESPFYPLSYVKALLNNM